MLIECLLRSRHVLGAGDPAVNKTNNNKAICIGYLRPEDSRTNFSKAQVFDFGHAQLEVAAFKNELASLGIPVEPL